MNVNTDIAPLCDIRECFRVWNYRIVKYHSSSLFTIGPTGWQLDHHTLELPPAEISVTYNDRDGKLYAEIFEGHLVRGAIFVIINDLFTNK